MEELLHEDVDEVLDAVAEGSCVGGPLGGIEVKWYVVHGVRAEEVW